MLCTSSRTSFRRFESDCNSALRKFLVKISHLCGFFTTSLHNPPAGISAAVLASDFGWQAEDSNSGKTSKEHSVRYMLRSATLTAVLLASTTSSRAALVINEVFTNPPGTDDTQEFFEVKSTT